MTPERKRALIIAGVIGGIILLGYVVLKGRSGATAAGGGTSASPAAPTSDSAGAADSQQSDAAAILAALAGENQQLLTSFLNSSQGLASLAGSTFGSPPAASGTSDSGSIGSSGADFFSNPLSESSPTSDSSQSSPPTGLTITQQPGGISATDSSSFIGFFSTLEGIDQSIFPPDEQAVLKEALSSQTINSSMTGGGPTISAGSSAPIPQAQVQPLYGGSFDFSTATPVDGPTVTSPIEPGPNLGLGAVSNSKPGSGNLAE